MDSKYVRKTIENLLAELERNPAIGRRVSPSFMSRYGRPLGLGIALGVSGAAGCSSSSETSKNPDALPAGPDVLYPARDVYGIAMPDAPADTRDGPSPLYDVYVRPLDTGHGDAYGISGFRDGPLASDRPFDTQDSRDARSLNDVDVRPLDGGPVDVYGIAGFRDGPLASDRPVDTRDVGFAQPPASDAGRDTSSDDADSTD